MIPKENILNAIKDQETKEIWSKIYDSYIEGGKEGVTNTLNKMVQDVESNYENILTELRRKL